MDQRLYIYGAIVAGIPWLFLKSPRWMIRALLIVLAMLWVVPVWLGVSSIYFCTAGGDACGGGAGVAFLLSLGSLVFAAVLLISTGLAFVVAKGISER